MTNIPLCKKGTEYEHQYAPLAESIPDDAVKHLMAVMFLFSLKKMGSLFFRIMEGFAEADQQMLKYTEELA